MAERIVKSIHNVFKQYRKVNLVNPYWFAKPFESSWRTSNTSTGSSTSTQVKLPLVVTGSYDFTVNWGDGNKDVITVWNQAQTTHTYSVAGDYTIKIVGTCIGWRFANTGDRLKLLTITTWGNLRLGNLGNYFDGCSNLNLTGVTDVLNLTGTTNFARFFALCSVLTAVNRISEWSTSLVTSTNNMFLQCFVYNQNMGALNWSSNSDFVSMFNNATAFNNGGSTDIANWILKTTGTISMNSMFQGANFNQPIGTWNMIAVTSITSMFSNSNFNQNIGAWNVSNIVSFLSTFQNAFNFNNGGSSTINNWVLNTSLSVNLSLMFRDAPAFNQPIGNWNTIRVNNMSQMFLNAINFNQNIGGWNTANVLNMSQMLQNATNFNQNIGAWVISSVANFTNFMNLKTAANFSTSNLDAIYNTTTGWASRAVVSGISISFGTIKYTAAGSAGRAILTGAPNLWSITDGGI